MDALILQMLLLIFNMYNFLGDEIGISATTKSLLQISGLCWFFLVWDILILEIFYIMMYNHNLQGDLTGSASFSKIKYIFFRYSDPENIFLDNKNK